MFRKKKVKSFARFYCSTLLILSSVHITFEPPESAFVVKSTGDMSPSNRHFPFFLSNRCSADETEKIHAYYEGFHKEIPLNSLLDNSSTSTCGISLKIAERVITKVGKGLCEFCKVFVLSQILKKFCITLKDFFQPFFAYLYLSFQPFFALLSLLLN